MPDYVIQHAQLRDFLRWEKLSTALHSSLLIAPHNTSNTQSAIVTQLRCVNLRPFLCMLESNSDFVTIITQMPVREAIQDHHSDETQRNTLGLQDALCIHHCGAVFQHQRTSALDICASCHYPMEHNVYNILIKMRPEISDAY